MLLISSLSPIATTIKVSAAGEAFTEPGDQSAVLNEPYTVTGLQVNGTGDDTLTVDLYATYGVLEMTTTTGITFNSATTGSNLKFSGSRSNINTALSTLTYTSDTLGDATIEIRLGGADGDVYNPDNEHVYQIVSAEGYPDNLIDWSTAKTAAESKTYGGVNGYLATITDQAEHDFIMSRVTDDGWIGANDIANEGQWRWVTGPEGEAEGGAGALFWLGAANGTLTEGFFENWAPNEPNDNNGIGEDCGQLRISVGGEWNDLPCGNGLPFFIVEYGEEGNLPVVAATQFNIATIRKTVSIGTCDELVDLAQEEMGTYNINLTADIDCAEKGTFNNTIFPSGYSGRFDGNGHTIRNVSMVVESENVALFAYSNGADFINLTLENFDVMGLGRVSALVAESVNSVFENITLNNIILSYQDNYAGTLSADFLGGVVADVHATNISINSFGGGSHVGGLIGYAASSIEGAPEVIITNSSSSGAIYSEGADVGGLIGKATAEAGSSLSISKVFSTVDITVNQGGDIGGLIGEYEAEADTDTNAILQYAYAWGNISAPNSDKIGGLIGRYDIEQYDEETSTIILREAYAKGNVSGISSVGGLIGSIDSSQTYEISNTFAMGKVTSSEEVTTGGLVGLSEIDVESMLSTNNYFDVFRSYQEICNTGVEIENCTGVNNESTQPNYFFNNNTNAPLDSWDFENVWVMNLGTTPTFASYDASIDDDDGDGISNGMENNAPNEGDGNNDGILDSEQTYVTSLLNPNGNNYVVLETTCISNTSLEIFSLDYLGTDNAFTYPVGLLRFVLNCNVEAIAQIKQYYYGITQDPSLFVVRKHMTDGGFRTLTEAVVALENINDESVVTVSYEVIDGGELDDDGEVNGVIVDPVGLALNSVGSPNTGIGGKSFSE